VQSRPAFEIPYSEISNTNLAGKNEVAVEFSLQANGEDTGTNGHLGGARARGMKTGGARDQLVEMRFYIPGTTITKKGEKRESGDEGSEEEEEQNAAQLFYETLAEKAEIGEVAGDAIANFEDILHLTPRCVSKMFRVSSKFNAKAEVVSRLQCTKAFSDSAARHMTTRFNMIMSRSSCFCPSQTRSTSLL
jgi:hypothetical protein